MRAFVKELHASVFSPVALAAWVFVALIMAIAGPFGSYEEVPFLRRLGFWLVLVAVCIVLASGARALVVAWVGPRDFWRGGALTAGLVTVILTLPLGWLAADAGDTFRVLPPSLGEIAVFIFCMTFGFFAVCLAMDMGEPAGPLPAFAEAPVLPRLAERLPQEVRGVVHRVTGRDHYVEVVTDKGSTTLLMRFSDALAELDGCDGLQVHRSHWVAAEAVGGAVQDGNRVFLRLLCGGLVPVSRTYIARVKARGWLPEG